MRKNNTRKTLYTWIVLVVCGILVLSLTIGEIFVVLNQGVINTFSLDYSDNLGAIIWMNVGLVIGWIYLIKLFKMRKDVFLWLHLFFGHDVIRSSFHIVNSLRVGDLTDFELRVPALIVSLIVWITFYNHLKDAKKEKRMTFS